MIRAAGDLREELVALDHLDALGQAANERLSTGGSQRSAHAYLIHGCAQNARNREGVGRVTGR